MFVMSGFVGIDATYRNRGLGRPAIADRNSAQLAASLVITENDD